MDAFFSFRFEVFNSFIYECVCVHSTLSLSVAPAATPLPAINKGSIRQSYSAISQIASRLPLSAELQYIPPHGETHNYIMNT